MKIEPMPIDPALTDGALGLEAKIIDGMRETWMYDPPWGSYRFRWDVLVNGSQVHFSLSPLMFTCNSLDDPELSAWRAVAKAKLYGK